jgi:colanic acid biosynthesis glycosyl transferase WcaI
MSRRRLYCVNQFGWPDGAATAQILCEVLRTTPPSWSVVLLQSASQYSPGEDVRAPQIDEIVRLWAPKVGREWFLGRLLGFLAFYFQVAWLLWTRPQGSDVVAMTTPPFLNWLGAIGKSLRGGRLISWEMDVYPELLYSTRLISKNGLIGRLVAKVTQFARSSTDLTLVLGPCMTEVVTKGGVPEESCFELHNWADGDILHSSTAPGLRPQLVVLYSGNLGVAHDWETVACATDILRYDAVRFVFAGGGVGIKHLRAALEVTRENVQFQGACKLGQLSSVLNAADIGLVTQTQASLGCVVPSKFYGLLAVGRGVLYVGPEEATVAQVIRETGCGWIVRLGDSEGMARLIRGLEADRGRVREVGERARRVFDERFTREKGVARFWELLASLDDKRTN